MVDPFGSGSDSGIPGPLFFRTTSWDLLDHIKGEEHRTNALENFVLRYHRPLRVYLQQRGYRRDQAEDLVQDFFASAIEKGLLERPSRSKQGRFRNWLLVTFNRFVKDRAVRRQQQFEKDLARIADGDAHLDLAENIKPDSAEEMFERQWAWDLLQRGYRILRERVEEPWQFMLFELKSKAEAEGRKVPWEELARLVDRADLTRGQLKYAWNTVQTEARNLLREMVAEEFQEPSASELDQEVQRLWAMLEKGPAEAEP